jgi:hypothetical protein
MSDRQEDHFMRTNRIIPIFVWGVFITLMGYSAGNCAEVSVNIGIGIPVPQVVIPAPPPVVINDPPPVVVIPGTYIYFAPDVGVDIFFYHGYWYRPHHGYWYRARGYNGPWGNIESARVPHVVRDLPPDFRHTVRQQERIRHVDLQRNWKTWEQNKHWDRRDYRHEVQGAHDGRRWKDNHSRPDYRHEGRDARDDRRYEDNQSRPGGGGRHEVREVRDVRDGGILEKHQSNLGGREKHKQ